MVMARMDVTKVKVTGMSELVTGGGKMDTEIRESAGISLSLNAISIF